MENLFLIKADVNYVVFDHGLVCVHIKVTTKYFPPFFFLSVGGNLTPSQRFFVNGFCVWCL